MKSLKTELKYKVPKLLAIYKANNPEINVKKIEIEIDRYILKYSNKKSTDHIYLFNKYYDKHLKGTRYANIMFWEIRPSPPVYFKVNDKNVSEFISDQAILLQNVKKLSMVKDKGRRALILVQTTPKPSDVTVGRGSQAIQNVDAVTIEKFSLVDKGNRVPSFLDQKKSEIDWPSSPIKSVRKLPIKSPIRRQTVSPSKTLQLDPGMKSGDESARVLTKKIASPRSKANITGSSQKSINPRQVNKNTLVNAKSMDNDKMFQTLIPTLTVTPTINLELGPTQKRR